MKKLTLNPDHLEVQTFETVLPPNERGTVKGHATEGGAWGESCVVAYTCICIGTETCQLYCEAESGSLSVCGCETGACTGNAGEIACYDSYNFCLETQRPLHSCPTCP